MIARRLVEQGVRVVQLNHSIDGYDIAWDTGHGDIKGGHSRLAHACDQGIAALLKKTLKAEDFLKIHLLYRTVNLEEPQHPKALKEETMIIMDTQYGWLAEV